MSCLQHGSTEEFAVTEPVIDRLTGPFRRRGGGAPSAEAALVQSARALSPPFLAIAAERDAPFSSTGCADLDAALGGGLPLAVGALVEVSGRAGSGKTQLGLQTALAAAAAAPSGAAIHLMAGGRFPLARAKQIAASRFCDKEDEVEDEVDKLLSRLVVETAHTPAALETWARHRLPYLLRETRAKVVVVDALAAAFRHEMTNPMQRAAALVRTAQALVSAVRDVGGVVVCINQVTQRLDSDAGRRGDLVPAMGHAWDVCVSMRIWLDRSDDATLGARRRSLRLVHAPHLEPSADPVDVVIDHTGIYASSA